MIVEHEIDCGDAYERERNGLCRLVAGLDAPALRTAVPATPAWNVRDVMAHLVGLSADLNRGNFGDGDPDEWTARQVEARRALPTEELLAEWDDEAPHFAAGLRLFGYEVGAHFVADLVQHRADVHHALGIPAAPDGAALVAAADFLLDTFHEALLAAGSGPVEVTVDDPDEPAVVHVGIPGTPVRLTVDRYELVRALGGRRSIAQLRSLAWSADPGAVVTLMSPYGVRTDDLVGDRLG